MTTETATLDFEGFARAVLEKALEDGDGWVGGIEAEDLHALALKYRLLVEVPYREDVHGEADLAEGDVWCEAWWVHQK